jgi:5-formyltetrahydrofolate cyclo-ligase
MAMQKREARDRGRALRQALPEAVREENDAAILERAQQELPWEQYRRVHMFLPITHLYEINTWQLLQWIWTNHPKIRVFLPTVFGHGLEHVRATIGTDFKLNRYGIPEPTHGEVLQDDEPLDLIFVPLLCIDRRGYRVGYGGGYYDRFLAKWTEPRKVGLAYESWIVDDEIEVDEYDVPLDGLITEERYVAFG